MLYTCQDRIDNGAVWKKGAWHPDGYYLVSSAVGEPIALPACFDLLAEHAVTGSWRVEWTGTVLRPPGRGLALWFEKGLHGVIYDETMNTTGTWTTKEFTPDSDYFVFVAMPHHGDKWTWVEIKVYPPPHP